MNTEHGGPGRLRETPLADEHRALGARMIAFAGWNMPVQYTGILEEHRTVREKAGLFDLSHMGELWLSGPAALANLQRLTTNDAAKLRPGQAQYTLLTNPTGGVIDDLILYCVSDTKYLLIVNAANTEKDRDWILQNLDGAVELHDASAATALIAVQGPKAAAIVQRVTAAPLDGVAPFQFVETKAAGCDALVARTGYTGEDGFECLVEARDARTLWTALLEAGKGDGMLPCGLGARDTLRLEARLCLYGHELTEETTPLEAGLGAFVKFEKGDFIGREALLRQKAEGVSRRLVGFVMEERGIPRQGYAICDAEGRAVGSVTSGSFAPSLEKEIGLGYVATPYAQADASLWIEIRNRRLRARIVQGRFLALRQ